MIFKYPNWISFQVPALQNPSSNPFNVLSASYHEPSADSMRNATNEEREQPVIDLAREIRKYRGEVDRLVHDVQKTREPNPDTGGEAGDEVERSDGEWTRVGRAGRR